MVDRLFRAVGRFARYACLANAFFLAVARAFFAATERGQVAPGSPCSNRTDDDGISARGARVGGRSGGGVAECRVSCRRTSE